MRPRVWASQLCSQAAKPHFSIIMPMYKAAYMFKCCGKTYYWDSKKCLSGGGVWWKCGNLHIVAQNLAKICRRWQFSTTLKEILKNLQSVANIHHEWFSRWRFITVLEFHHFPRVSEIETSQLDGKIKGWITKRLLYWPLQHGNYITYINIYVCCRNVGSPLLQYRKPSFQIVKKMHRY